MLINLGLDAGGVLWAHYRGWLMALHQLISHRIYVQLFCGMDFSTKVMEWFPRRRCSYFIRFCFWIHDNLNRSTDFSTDKVFLFYKFLNNKTQISYNVILLYSICCYFSLNRNRMHCFCSFCSILNVKHGPKLISTHYKNIICGFQK